MEIPTQWQLDWRWIERIRQITSYEVRWWWAPVGPFCEEEQRQWDQLIGQERSSSTKKLLDKLIVQSRDREVDAAIRDQREPRFLYPVLASMIEEIHQRIIALRQLESEILQQEPHRVVRRLYHEAIREELDFLYLLETAHTGDNDRFWQISRLLHPVPTRTEMRYPLAQVKNALLEGLRYEKTRELSLFLIRFVRERFQLSSFVNDEEITHEREKEAPLPPAKAKKTVSAQAAKRFFEQILLEGGYNGWQVEIDPKAGGASVSSTLRRLSLQDEVIALDKVRHLLSHEIAGHIARSYSGEHSPLGLLALGTAGYTATEEGFALYNERATASLYGEDIDSPGSWIGMLSVGLACGVETPPQSFTSLLDFLQPFFLQRRLIEQIDTDVPTAQKYARSRAVARCLRTFRGVPDLTGAGICYTKDVSYLRGLRLIEQAVVQDKTVLDRLGVGKIALEQLGDVQELNLVPPPQPLRKRAFDPDLDAYILSFEIEN